MGNDEEDVLKPKVQLAEQQTVFQDFLFVVEEWQQHDQEHVDWRSVNDEFGVTALVFEGNNITFDVLVLVDFVEESTLFSHVTVNVTQDSYEVVQQEDVSDVQVEDHDKRMHLGVVYGLYSDVILIRSEYCVKHGSE